MDALQLAVTYLVTITAAIAVVVAVTLYTMVRQPHLRPGLGALLLVALPSQLFFATLLWIVTRPRGNWPSCHPTTVDACLGAFSCIALLVAPLVLVRLFRAPREQRVPRPLTVAHGIIWAFTVLLICLLTSGGY